MDMKHVIVCYLCYFNNIYGQLRFLVNRIQNGYYFNRDK